MAKTRTAVITVDKHGHRILDKEYRNVRICARLGRVSQRKAERRLRAEIHRVDTDLERKTYLRPSFADCATRYLAESRFKRSAKVIKWHVELLNSHVGQLEIDRVHDGTLAPFIADRLVANVSATT